MALDKRARETMRESCGEIHDDDGVDPREFFQRRGRPRRENPKVEQLCRQAAETLSQVLAGEFEDQLLHGLLVTSVRPAPDASRLLVTLVADCEPRDFDRAEIERRLAVATGRLRTAVAGAVTRRKAPALAFVVLGPADEHGSFLKGGDDDRS